MNHSERFSGRNDHLKRLPREFYQGKDYVHWSMTIEGRKTGWLNPMVHLQFREVLTHTAFRYGFCVPIYCCMPDHFHLLWVGIHSQCDQIVAAKFFRKQLNLVLEKVGVRLQAEGYDHVLLEKEMERTGFEDVVGYISRNPERAGLVSPGEGWAYPYTDCLIPGYPELHVFQPDYWARFWRTHAFMVEKGMGVSS